LNWFFRIIVCAVVLAAKKITKNASTIIFFMKQNYGRMICTIYGISQMASLNFTENCNS
jgi:hypothetical protein